MAKQWEVKTIYDATDDEIANMLNEGWKMIGMCSYTESDTNPYTDQLEFNVSIVTTFKRKVKPSKQMVLTFEEVTPGGYDEDLLNKVKAIHPEARLFSTDDQVQIRFDGQTFTSTNSDHALESFRYFIESLRVLYSNTLSSDGE